jgi:hypothetical protein
MDAFAAVESFIVGVPLVRPLLIDDTAIVLVDAASGVAAAVSDDVVVNDGSDGVTVVGAAT